MGQELRTVKSRTGAIRVILDDIMQAELIRATREGDACKIEAMVYDSAAVLDKVASLSGKEVHITISEPKENRTLDQNAYLWLIIRKIALKLHITPDETYRKLLSDYGQFVVVTVKQGTNLEKAGFKYFEILKDGLINGKPFTAYKVFIGSSQYDKEEMGALLDGAIAEAKGLGLEVDLEDYVSFMDN